MCPVTNNLRLYLLLPDCKIFMKLDLRQGYHQLTLSPAIRQVATFSTPWGNYRPKRLVFGAKSPQDVFDEATFRAFRDIPHGLNQRDNILLRARDVAEHRQVLKTVLQRARDHGVTFNKEKCQLAKVQIEFFGYETDWNHHQTKWKQSRKAALKKAKKLSEVSRNGRRPGQLHQQLCGHSSTTSSANPERQNSNGRKKNKTHSGRYKTSSQTTRQWHSLTHPDL